MAKFYVSNDAVKREMAEDYLFGKGLLDFVIENRLNKTLLVNKYFPEEYEKYKEEHKHYWKNLKKVTYSRSG